MPLPSRPRRGRHRHRSLLSVLGICATALTAAPATAHAAPAGPSRPAGAHAKIDTAVLARMDAAEARGDGRVEAAVVLRAAAGSLPDGTATEVRRALARGTAADQAPVVDLVEANGDRVLNTFWLKNMVLVRATPDTLRQLAALAPVERVIPNFTLETPPGETPEKSAAAVARATAGATTWGLAKIGADKAQDDRKLTGAGVRVAVLDTGIDIAHPDLSGKLAGADSADPAHPGAGSSSTPKGARSRAPCRTTAPTTAPTSPAPSRAATPPAPGSAWRPAPNSWAGWSYPADAAASPR